MNFISIRGIQLPSLQLMEQTKVSAERTVSKSAKHALILKFTLKQPLTAHQSLFFQKPALRPTASEATRSEKCFKTQTQG